MVTSTAENSPTTAAIPSALVEPAAPFHLRFRTAFDSGSDTFRCSYGYDPGQHQPIATYTPSR